MRAVWNNQTIAQADKNGLIFIEGNWYFPPRSIKEEYFQKNDHHTSCYWKGEASYYDIVVGADKNENAAWYYPDLIPSSIKKVGRDFTNYIGFWRGVEVVD